MSSWWYDPLIHGVGAPSTTLGATPNTTAWPGGTTLGATLATATYSTGVSLGDTPNSAVWPPTGGASPIDFFGQNTVGGATARSITANVKVASSFALPEAADLVNMYVYVDGGGAGSGSQLIRGVIYADSSGAPGALLATTDEVTISDVQALGWVELSFPTLVELSTGTYWLGFIAGATTAVGRYYTVAGGSEDSNADTYVGGAATPFGTPTVNVWTDCVYATYIPSAVAPTMLFEDGFENQNHANWNGPGGGRAQACDCQTVCPGGAHNTADPLDSYVAYGVGYARRTATRRDCRSQNATCHSACEVVKDWGIATGYKLGQTEYFVYRSRVKEPYVAQNAFCLIAQFGYPQIRGPGFGLNIYGTSFVPTFSYGYHGATLAIGFANAWGYYTRQVGDARGNLGPVWYDMTPEAWQDHLLEIKYCTIYGQSGGSSNGTNPITGAAISFPYQGYARLSTRRPDLTSSWTPVWDTRVDSCSTATAKPFGCPTRQWGYGSNAGPLQYEVDHNGKNVVTAGGFIINDNRKVYDKMGTYRANPQVAGYAGLNDNTFIVDARTATASTLGDANDWLDQLTT